MILRAGKATQIRSPVLITLDRAGGGTVECNRCHQDLRFTERVLFSAFCSTVAAWVARHRCLRVVRRVA